uniref:C2H2-type domain-containing protein n=1 Tax=Photinus pyralis TaxID=7054 RepID=A0A1Y1N3P9_PHOPY
MDLVCRTCLNVVKSDSFYIHLNQWSGGNDVRDREKLEACVPELTLDVVVDPIICGSCKEKLTIFFKFKEECLETEKFLFNCIQQRRQNENCTDLLSNYDLLTLVKNDVVLEHSYSSIKKFETFTDGFEDDSPTNVQAVIKSALTSLVQSKGGAPDSGVEDELNYDIDHVVHYETVECCYSEPEELPETKPVLKSIMKKPRKKKSKGRRVTRSSSSNRKSVKIKMQFPPVKTKAARKMSPIPKVPPRRSVTPRKSSPSTRKSSSSSRKSLPPTRKTSPSSRKSLSPPRKSSPAPSKIAPPSPSPKTSTPKIMAPPKKRKISPSPEHVSADTSPQFDTEDNVQKAIEENKENVSTETKVKPAPKAKSEPKPKLSYLCPDGFQCTKCDKAFRYRCHFKMHERAHLLKKDYICPQCGKIFTQERYLKYHITTHTAPRTPRFRCNMCNKCLGSRTSLRRHIRLHTGERPYTCNVCKKEFSQKTQLEVHERTHSGEKPFVCNMCNTMFSQKSHLQNHMLIHTGERPYQCEKCRKRFSKNSVLRVHMQIHEDKPYQCSGCTKFFKELSSYRKHVGKYLPKCVAGRRAFKVESVKLKANSKVLEDINNDLNEINRDIAEDVAKALKLKTLQYFCKVCSKGFTTNFSRNRHLKFQHPPK